MAHDCFDFRERGVFEGDDAMVERCSLCGRVRYESDGVRPMAWMATGKPPRRWMYAYADPRNRDDVPEVWKNAELHRAFHLVPDGYDDSDAARAATGGEHDGKST